MLFNKQSGSSHVFIVVGLILLLIGSLLYVLFQNHQKRVAPESYPNTSVEHVTNEGSADLDVNNWRIYKSFTGSGLSFKYPEDWSFTPPSEQFVTGDGKKLLLITLKSIKPSKAKPSKYMCVQLTERIGGDGFTQSDYPGDANSIEQFYVGSNLISLHKSQFGYQLYNKDSDAKHGAFYVPLNGEFVLTAIAQYNCASSDKQDLDTDPVTRQAELILKSIQVSN